MKIFIATEARVYIVGNQYFASNPLCKVLERYHRFFGDFVLCTRFQRKENKNELSQMFEDATHLIHETVSVDSLNGVVVGKYDKVIEESIQSCQLVIARVPSVIANKAAAIARKNNVPYLAEVIGCIWDSYWNYSQKSKFIALPAFLMMRKVVREASYATYVTEKFLQKRYPCTCESIHCSNVLIEQPREEILDRRLIKIQNKGEGTFVLFTAAAVNVSYKGQEYVIRAMQLLKQEGIHLSYRLAGGGDQTRLAEIAKECGVQEAVFFLGGLSRDGVETELDKADVYIQPSLQEGLPRAVIEAMSRACPCLGAKTAGIPELISPECIFKRANPQDTARAIKDLIHSDMRKYAKLNFEKSKDYERQVLEDRRKKYYAKVLSEIEG